MLMTSSPDPSFVRAPSWPVLAATACVAVSFVMVIVEAGARQTTNLAVSATGYVLGSVATAVFVVLHRVLAQRAARDVWFTPSRSLDLAARALLLAGLACGGWHAFVFASEIARR